MKTQASNKIQHKGATRGKLKGQAAVEFALTFMILLVLIYGIIEVSRLIFISSAVQNGAREGARFLSVNPGASNGELRAAVLPRMTLVDSSVLITKDPAGPICDFCPITATVTYNWSTLIPILNFGSVTLRSSSTKLIENTITAPTPTP